MLLIAWGCAPVASALASDHAVAFPADALPAQYSPSSVEAAVGDTVTFSGAFASHPLAWSDGDFTLQNSGTTRSYTFTKPGNFTFHCTIHASMFGNVHVPGNQFATPEFTWGPAAPKTGDVVTFTAGAFTDPDGTISRYEWDLDGNGSFESTGATQTHTYASAGSVSVSLRYVDDGHETSPATTHVVNIAQGPVNPGGGGGGGGTGGGGTGGGGGGTTTNPSPTPPTSPGGATPGTGGAPGGSTTAPGGDDGGAGPGSAGTNAPRVRLGARALSFRSGRASAAVTISVAGSARATLKRGAVVLATSATTALHTGSGSIRLTLTKAGKAALRRARGKKLTATLSVTAHRNGSKQTATVKRTLTVKLAA